MKTRVTIKLKIPYNEEIVNIMKQYSKAITYISNQGFKNNINNRYKLHHLTYYKTKNKFKLPSQYIINAIRVASQTLKSTKLKVKPSYKEFMPIDFDRRTFTFSFNKVRITTTSGRTDIPIEIPEYYWKYLDWRYQTARILESKGKLFIHVTFSRDITILNNPDNFIGVDVGINNIAVTSNKQFFSGIKIKTYMIKLKQLRARLQSKGTRSSQKLLKKISGRQRRFVRHWNHVISKQIVTSCNAGTIVLENIKGIRNNKKGKRLNFWLNGWSFFQLHNFITYKAMRRGINVIKVSPFCTSQICSRCRELGTRSKGYFFCFHCGYSLNADLNASFNLAKHHSMTDGVSATVTSPHIQVDEHKGALCTIECETMDKYPTL